MPIRATWHEWTRVDMDLNVAYFGLYLNHFCLQLRDVLAVARLAVVSIGWASIHAARAPWASSSSKEAGFRRCCLISGSEQPLPVPTTATVAAEADWWG